MKREEPRNARMVPLALIGLLLAGHSYAAETPAQKRERELAQRLEKSEEQAASLQQRIERLERQLEALRAAVPATSRVPTAAKSPEPAAAAAPTAPPPAVAQSQPPTPRASGAGSASSPAARSGPGSFVVDEEAAQRALERTLTQAGALLLPPRTIEVTPSYSYRRTELETSVPATITTTAGSSVVLANQRTRRNENTARVDVRVGMPYGTQAELSLPYNYVRSSQVTDLGSTTSANGNGIGDITLGVAKTLMREKGPRPDLIGRLTYNLGNGDRLDNGVPMSGGHRQLQAELVAIKRQDPLAFVASTFYSNTWEEDGIKPGDAAGFSLTAVLAASPATSLQLGFSQIHRTKQENNGVKIPGSDQTYGVATIGASSVLSRDMTLVTQLGIGLGNDAPKYSFTVSLPILFR